MSTEESNTEANGADEIAAAIGPDSARPAGLLAASALALLAGLLICAALPPWGWWPLAPVGIALWIHLLGGRRARDRFLLSWVVGIGWFGPSTLWMWGLTSIGYPVGVAIGWGPMVAVVGLLCPPDRRRIVALPAAIVLFEWFHSHAPFGGVPLSLLAMTQTRTPALAIARLGGDLLLGLAVAALGSALYLALTRRWRPAVGVAAAVAVVTAIGTVWPIGEPHGSVRIAAVQGGGPQGTRYTAGEEPGVFMRHMEATATIPANDGGADDIDVVVWPENAINVGGTFEEHPWRIELAAEAERIGAPIVVGIVEDAGPGREDQFLNAVVVVNLDGTVGDRFDKKRRVPFGEYVPLRPFFAAIAGDQLPPRDQVPGQEVAVIDTPAGPMAVAVSWEVFFSRRIREGVRAGGEVILNPTNGSSYWLTQVQTQQVASSQLRSMSSARWLVQVSPTGFSAFVDPDGTVLQRTSISEQEVLVADVERYTSTVPAQALGDIPALLLAAVALAWVWIWIPRRRDDDAATTVADGSAGLTPDPPPA